MGSTSFSTKSFASQSLPDVISSVWGVAFAPKVVQGTTIVALELTILTYGVSTFRPLPFPKTKTPDVDSEFQSSFGYE